LSPYGLTGRFLEVDLSSKSIRETRIPGYIYRMYIGGRGLATYILWRELGRKWHEIDPLGPENMLIIATGPLTGFYPGIKLAVSGKSPQSNGVIGSTVSSDVAFSLKAAGYDGIIIKGASQDPVYLYIEDEHVEIRDAGKLWGLKGSGLLEALRRELGSDEPSLYIGPAGENLVRTAAVMSRWFHAAGYGGYGAVMGSKKLKAIVVKGCGPLPRVADQGEYIKLWREVVERVSQRRIFRQWGTTAGLWETGYDTSSEPIMNWREEWHNNKDFSHLALESKHWVKNPWADWGCPLACMKVSKTVIEGKIYYTDGPDYEMGAYLGCNLGVFRVEEVIALSSMADELGLCGIQTGNTLGFALELYEKGYLTREDIGYELKWGDFNSLKRLLEDIAYRRGMGSILAEGAYRAALKIAGLKNLDPGELLRYTVQVKGVGVGAHGIRSGKDYPQPIAYAGSVQGGDHTSVAGLPVDNDSSEAWSVFLDSGVVCMFTAVDDSTMIKYLNTVTGWNITREEFYGEIAPRVLSLQRILLLLGGPDATWDPRIHDDNPPRFYEPLPSGPYKGARVDPSDVRSKLAEYYKGLGWDEYGIPTEETLRRLKLYDAVEVARELRERIEG